jgi:hypothetical protein
MAKTKIRLHFSSRELDDFFGDIPLPEMQERASKFSFRDMLTITHLALKAGAKKEGREFSDDLEAVHALIDTHPGLIGEAMDAFNKGVADVMGGNVPQTAEV